MGNVSPRTFRRRNVSVSAPSWLSSKSSYRKTAQGVCDSHCWVCDTQLYAVLGVVSSSYWASPSTLQRKSATIGRRGELLLDSACRSEGKKLAKASDDFSATATPNSPDYSASLHPALANGLRQAFSELSLQRSYDTARSTTLPVPVLLAARSHYCRQNLNH